MEKQLIEVLGKTFEKLGIKLNSEKINDIVEIPETLENGDFSLPCFSFSKILKKSPKEIAKKLSKEIKKIISKDFEKIEVSGGYINFFLNKEKFSEEILKNILKEKENYGKESKKNKTLIVEFSSPNIAKPFHIGHLRSTIIGNSLSKMAEFKGFKVKKINYLGDWGTQFGKLIFGYKKFGNKKEFEKDPLKYMLKIYVKVSQNKDYETGSRAWFKKLEEGDKSALKIWKLFKEKSLENFEKIYGKMHIEFDEFSSESEIFGKTEEVINILKKKKLLVKDDGAWIIDLKKYSLGVSIIIKSDGATTYVVRDIAEAIRRFENNKFYKMIYEVGGEQKLHFEQLFKILELMNLKWAKNCEHVYHGFYLGNDGKKFATRKGSIVYLENILDETEKLAKEEILKRDKEISKEDLENRAKKISIAAIFYGDLKNYRKNDVVFDLQKFIHFEGDTGPYLLYSYARASSIIKKIKRKENYSFEKLEIEEYKLIKLLSEFKEVLAVSYKNLNPSLIAKYSYKLSKTFNEFYHCCPVINSKKEPFRRDLVEAFRIVLKSSLSLLGIETLEKM